MPNRRVSKKWREAIKMVVPHGDFRVISIEGYNFMRVMTTELPNLQQITLSRLFQNGRYGNWDKYSDGEDPDEEYAARTFDHTPHDIEIISNFQKLHTLTIKDNMSSISSLLNGSYPFLFDSFPLLQKLRIQNCKYLKWDLGMLSAFPLLKELYVSGNDRLTGNIRCLIVLEDTLETLSIGSCTNVEGNLMDLADFPLLKELNLYNTAVKGDVRDIGENDFTNLEKLRCPFGVVGGRGYKFEHIADVASVANAFYRLAKRAKPLREDDYSYYYSWTLSEQSPDHYGESFLGWGWKLAPPLCINFVEVGSRLGWRWSTPNQPEDDEIFGDETEYPAHSCEINWLDPEPDREDDGYQAYILELESIQKSINIYRGYHQPPTEEEYRRLCREVRADVGTITFS
jgi:hypothetical protein